MSNVIGGTVGWVVGGGLNKLINGNCWAFTDRRTWVGVVTGATISDVCFVVNRLYKNKKDSFENGLGAKVEVAKATAVAVAEEKAKAAKGGLRSFMIRILTNVP